MSSYNKARGIMEELGLRAKKSTSKKVFVVVLEGTEAEFDEIRRLGGVELDDMSVLSRLPKVLTNLVRSTYASDVKSRDNDEYDKLIQKNVSISTESVVTERDVAQMPEEVQEIVLKGRGIITPLARDLAQKRGIRINKA